MVCNNSATVQNLHTIKKDARLRLFSRSILVTLRHNSGLELFCKEKNWLLESGWSKQFYKN
ncbi:hypothetical protein BpHYR1_054531 [Brachionus plicatilis]|uniref:Uncharacterized protein n=1 Tax=Brachionus plicatilis TaxID=10195 RepID=A0A3M7R363_BRAPC|nr:hypothetical protein BpHYR1_054531 [Brachionus plicatilis]